MIELALALAQTPPSQEAIAEASRLYTECVERAAINLDPSGEPATVVVDVAMSSCRTPRVGVYGALRDHAMAVQLSQADADIFIDLGLERAEQDAREWALRMVVEARADRFRE